jgi:N-acetylmuramoyl-L-alanine amidase
MKGCFLRYKDLFFYFSFFTFVFLGGCATVPRAGGAFPYPTIRIHDLPYFALLPMCEAEGIKWDYDPLSKVLILKKEKVDLRLLVGSAAISDAGTIKKLSGPIDIKDSVIYAPTDLRDIITPPVCKFPEKKAVSDLYLRSVDSVILDAGHGGKDPGAIGSQGLREKDVVLDVAQRVRQELTRCGLEADTTRSSDMFIPLPGRSQEANEKKADLFVSIHANANRSRWIEGFEIYYLTESVDDDARALAAAENAPLEIEDSNLHTRWLSLKAMLWDLVYTENRKESIELAHFIGRAVCKKMGLKLLGVKGAPFAVLKGARMPAVLVEIGYISNRDGERKLRDTQYRQAMAEAIAGGIMDFKNYCEGRR